MCRETYKKILTVVHNTKSQHSATRTSNLSIEDIELLLESAQHDNEMACIYLAEWYLMYQNDHRHYCEKRHEIARIIKPYFEKLQYIS